MKTEIKILNSSCCTTSSPIREQLEKLAVANNIEVSIEELSDLQDTMPYGTMTFPSLVVNEKVYDIKNLQSDKDLLSILKS